MPKASGVLFDKVVTKGWRGGTVPKGSACAADNRAAVAPAAKIARIMVLRP
ncbi:hypothetical protein BwSH20_63360 [Bradyrhizobium ottawaense]|nr:hypothetical protein SG09_08080 [Bradyrhizobium ottawaense]GMO20596.1 hypothetical protein BwSF21_14510 [Bradyrhizobium ottawaense]GMO29430.1 hypothetical protein BwSH14_30980 [Bradyrhizobium ottawaense]GMO55214.1 hypothetical protein BwSF12_69430 [Bradyrhizobium ottawaense]GMO56078.1 hypothetical protein BwSG20_05390 [Bradyrhizobium ottawaense]